MVWPFGARRQKASAFATAPTPSRDAAPTLDPEPPDESELLAIALLKRAHEASIGCALNEDFIVLMTDEEEARLRQLPDTRAMFEITCNEAHRYGLQVESAYNSAYTFSRL